MCLSIQKYVSVHFVISLAISVSLCSRAETDVTLLVCQEYIRRQLEEEQRHLEILQQQLLHEQAMLLVSFSLSVCVKLPLKHRSEVISINDVTT